MSLISALPELFESKKYADVTFIFKDEEIKAHKVVLSMRSKVFEAWLEGPMATPDHRYPINDPDISAEHFKTFLAFIYSDNERLITKNNVQQLIHLANMYDISALFEECMAFISKNSTKSNILYYAELAMIYKDSSELLTKCIQAVSAKDLTELTYVSPETSKTVLISEDLALYFVKNFKRTVHLSEDRVFKMVFKWVEDKCKEDNNLIWLSNIQAMMQKFMPFIKLEMLLPSTLAAIVRGHNLLSNDELIDAFCKQALMDKKADTKFSRIYSQIV